MDLELSGKRAVVTASSRGLGLGIAGALAREGADVLLTGRSGDRLAKAAAEITARGNGRAHFVVADLAQADAARTIHAAATTALGGIDIVVNNTGGPPLAAMAETPLTVLRDQFDAMVMRVVELSCLALPAMRQAGWGRILTVASSGVVQPIPNLGLSNTLRSALVGWSKTLSSEVGRDGVTVNVLLPGRIHTERVDEIDAAASKRQGKPVAEIAAASHATIPLGRYGTVEEFAAVAAFLVSGPASYVTGSLIRCDGGMIRSV
ncbi:SDR family oxidoreductase [Shumkonia mesophila]|uniref:SDR family oxidoreductase n=1 Tax=Shumkonia mesophila TaxID=2838854 RepID=UPI002934A28F|nr:SDR family oxidoreductase [Shumkonia mesophila]